MRLSLATITDNLDRNLAVVGAIASLFLISYTAISISRVVYVLPGVLTLLACVTWLVMRKRVSLPFQIGESRSKVHLFLLLYVIFLIGSILSVGFRPELYERPLLFFISTSLMAGAIACQILFSNERQKWLIIPQIIALGAIIVWSQLLLFPNVVGADPWAHQMVTTWILESQAIPGGRNYSYLPIFHLMVAMTSLVTDLGYKLAAMLSVSLVQIICNVLFLYLLAGLIFKNHKVGLFASLMVVIANHHIFMSLGSIPTSFAAVFIPIVFYVALKDLSDLSISKNLIIIILFLTTIFTHTLVSACLAILLLASWLSTVAFNAIHSREHATIPVLLPVLFTLAMYSWWVYASGHTKILAQLIELGFSRDFFVAKGVPGATSTYLSAIPVGEQVFNQFGMFLFFALSFIGVFYLLSRKDNKSFIIAVIGIIPLAIGFLSLLFGFGVIEHRWWYFAQILLSVPLGAAIVLLLKASMITSEKIIALGSLISISTFAFLLIMSPNANVDNHMFSPNTAVRSSLTESELHSINSIAEMYTREIGTEKYITNVISFLPLDIDLTQIDESIFTGDYSELEQRDVLIREDIKENSFKLFQGPYRLDYDLGQRIEGQGYSKTYNANSVTMYSNI
ncbi:MULTISPECIES: hypothetical protein [Methanoculleus]|uniref:Glycosyltransferase RgtA/B/C/D-like domain-containing protein n=2 Tax=Methanoculleus TaxID=45989 RepID=A3CTC5_METMJ|nr:MULTISPECIES: hypothetical protein [Methanoculleus]ABN56625.1 hypothetical protein Memar_0692 [Methanoculleus marisnigri JR1]UYU18064.1 hypothetical protein OH143_10190 [Methanoculleus submarinus]